MWKVSRTCFVTYCLDGPSMHCLLVWNIWNNWMCADSHVLARGKRNMGLVLLVCVKSFVEMKTILYYSKEKTWYRSVQEVSAPYLCNSHCWAIHLCLSSACDFNCERQPENGHKCCSKEDIWQTYGFKKCFLFVQVWHFLSCHWHF